MANTQSMDVIVAVALFVSVAEISVEHFLSTFHSLSHVLLFIYPQS